MNLKALFCCLTGIALMNPGNRVRERFSWALAATLALCALVLPGCSAHQQGSDAGVAMSIVLGGAGLFSGAYLATNRYYRLAWLCLLILALATLSGCAALPIPLQPKNSDYNSNMAEGAFIVLAGIDTLQTTHIRPGTSCAYEADPLARMLYRSRTPPPGRVIAVNLLMITAHTMVASWLDDRVAAEDARYNAEDRYGLGPWYATRFVFHAVSLIAESSAVFNNYNHGCKL